MTGRGCARPWWPCTVPFRAEGRDPALCRGRRSRGHPQAVPRQAHGPWFGVPPSGRQVEFRAMDLVRYRDGQLVEHWAVADSLSLLRQTGALT
ncbi:ester cyclase [Streptomyces sp. NPDC094438]|uniref:ester cyclase n=1 Tax=Streptomyces sp. NPDC094438 TaxID=3366061 RepID=UPI0037FE02BC